MAIGRVRSVLATVELLLRNRDERTDGDLLREFVEAKTEAAFAALVRRHGAMVLAVSRRILGNAADADDAVQATFLVLATKANSLKSRRTLGDWLHCVARRTALNARRSIARRREMEQRIVRPIGHPDNEFADILPILDEELARLPEKYRLPIVLCDLEGQSRTMAARQLRWPEGSVAGRLARGRQLLAKRLTKRGVSLTASGLAAALAPGGASASVGVATPTIAAAAAQLITSGQLAGASFVSAKVLALTQGVLKTMLLGKLKTVATMAILSLGLACGVGLIAHASVMGLAQADKEAAPKGSDQASKKPAVDAKSNDSEKPLRGPVIDVIGFPIQGRVVDENGKPVSGASIRLISQGFNGFDVDEKTTTDAAGQFRIAAPESWLLTDQTRRQELAVLAVAGDRLAILQFYRSSAPPRVDVELKLASVGGGKITLLSPDQRPVVGAKIKIVGLISDTIRADLTDEEAKTWSQRPKKTPIGYVIGHYTVALPPDLEMAVSPTDANGVATVANVAVDRIGAITVQSDEFGEQTQHSLERNKTTNWASRIILKKTGRVVGQLSGPAEAIGQRELTVSTFEHVQAREMVYGTQAKIVTDRDGKFEVPKMIPGMVRFRMKHDAAPVTRPVELQSNPQLKPDETLQLKIELKPTVRVEGRVLDAESAKPIRDVQVRSYFGFTGFESMTSDASGKFIFWMLPGEAAFHPDIPGGYLSDVRPTDALDHEKRQRPSTIFNVPEGKTFEAPPIRLHRPTTLRGVVLDDQGRPLPGTAVTGTTMTVDHRSGQPEPREIAAQTNERGEFTLAGIDPREPVRLKAGPSGSAKVVTVTKPASEIVRIVLTPSVRFTLSGRVADAEGKPIAEALLEVWHREWRQAPAVAEPKKLTFTEPIRADAQGHFKTPPLAQDGYYRFTVRGAGAKTTETEWLDATKPETEAPQQLVVARLGGLPGVLRDRGGKPVGNAQITLFTSDTRTETFASAAGEFKLDVPEGKPFSVIVRYPDFRAHGTHYEKAPVRLDQTMTRWNEPGEQLALRSILGKDERDRELKRLLQPLKQKLAKSTNINEKASSLQSLASAAPEFVIEFLDKNPLKPAMYNDMLLGQVAMKMAAHKPEEAEELIGRLNNLTQCAPKAMAYGAVVDALPDKARARKLELLAEALVAARAEKSPELRAVALGQVAKRLIVLGDKGRGTALLREGEKIANGLSTSAFAGFARGSFATDLALIDLPAALALIKGLKDPNEFNRHHGNTAHRIAGMQPAEAVKVLQLIPPPTRNQFDQRDHYAIRMSYRMAQADAVAALKLADGITDPLSRAYALGVIAQGVAKTNPKQATELIRQAFALLEDEATRPVTPQLTSPFIPGSAAAALVLIAEQVDRELVGECLWRSIALQRLPTKDSEYDWRYSTGNNAVAMVVARYDGKLAESILPPRSDLGAAREGLLAGFLVNPRQAIAAAEKAPKADTDREMLRLLAYLATAEDQIPRLILHELGIWRIDAEDIDS